MKKYVDLHMHSTFSDGENTREELISLAKKAGLSVISITDHDTTKGYFDFDLNNFDIEIMKGVEIVTTAGKCPVEVMIYGFEERDMQNFLEKNSLSHEQESKVKAEKEIKVLQSYGIKIDLDLNKYLDKNCKTWSVADLWKVLMKDSKAIELLKEENEELIVSPKFFFRKGLSNIKSKFFVDLSKDYISLKLLREYCDKNGLVMLLAHPGEYYTNLDIVLKNAVKYIDGIETYHPSINEELHKYLVDYCKKNNLLQGGGSDYHGFRGELNSEKVPYEMYLAIKERLEHLKNNRLITNIK